MGLSLSFIEDAIRDVGSALDDGVRGVFSGLDDALFQPITGGLQDGLQWLLGVDDPDLSDFDADRGTLLNKSSNTAKIPVVYGVRRIGGTRVFVGVSGAENEYLHIVLVLCEGEIQAINNVYINDIISTDAQYSGLITLTKYTGTIAQTADPDLVSLFSSWTSAHQLNGIAYIHAKIKWNNDAFSGFPRITCDVQGKKVYDVRTLTTGYSVNPALCIYDYLTNVLYGKGLEAASIDVQSFIDSANYCETTMENYVGSGVNINYFECNGVVQTSNRIIDNVKELLTTCRGMLPYSGGKYRLIIEKDEASTFTFTMDNIIGSWSFGGGSKRSRFNRVKAKFTNPLKNWQGDIAPQESAVYLANDNGLLLEKEISLPFETNAYRADYIAETALKKSRQQLTSSFEATIAALKVEVGNVVDIIHPTPGWVNKKFRVQSLNLLASGNVGVTLIEHEPTVYNRTVPPGLPTAPDTNLPNPFSVLPPTGLVLHSGSEHLVFGGDGTVLSQLHVTWVVPSDAYVSGYDVEYKKTSNIAWLPGAIVSNKTENEAHIVPVEDGVSYDVRVRTTNSLGVNSVWLSGAHVIIGKTQPPPNISTFLVQRQPDGTREFSWTHIPPADHAGYKIRYILGSSGTWATMTPLHDGLLTSSPHETNQLAAGTYTFAVISVDTTGNESANPLFINGVVLLDPRIAGSIDSADPKAMGWPGTKTNCWIDKGNLYATDTKTWADFAIDGVTWAGWTSWARAPNSPIIYEHPVLDVGVIATFIPLVSATGNGTIVIEESHSDDDISYTSWATAGAQITARYIKVRVTVTNASDLASITQMFIVLSADPVTEDIEDLATSTLTGANRIAVGHIKLPINETYAVIKRVDVVLQSVGAGWTWELISKGDLTNGPEIKIYNASNVLADATIDATIRGV